MLFNSVEFLVFLPVVILLYYLLPHRFRWVLLLAASYLFYAWWKVEFLLLIIGSTLLDYFAAQGIAKTAQMWKRKSLLALSLVFNLGLLFVFKYLVLFIEKPHDMTLNILAAKDPVMGMISYGIFYSIPVGISFYTFQTIGYTIDVYRGKIDPQRHLGKFALFVTYFPQLVAGPIERYASLNPQLDYPHKFSLHNLRRGLRLMLYGYFLKVGLADNLSLLVDPVFNSPGNFTTPHVWAGTFLFGFQIYGDFAGYTLIAQGAAKIMGVNLMDNFRTPYLATSIRSFWQRWHISLTSWFREYLYYPLGGNRTSKLRWVLNIFTVFIVSGFWHGANYTFLIWGGIHGLFYLIEHFVSGKPKNPSIVRRILGGIYTFIVVEICWVFFRIDSLEKFPEHWNALWASTGENTVAWTWPLTAIAALFVLMEVLLYNKRFDGLMSRWKFYWRWALYLAILFLITLWGGAADHSFIYFQF